MRFAAVWSKGNERRETSRPANIQTTPLIHTILPNGRMLRCAKWALPILTVALVVGQFRGQLRRFIGRKDSPGGCHW
jgi:hypothetical protein